MRSSAAALETALQRLVRGGLLLIPLIPLVASSRWPSVDASPFGDIFYRDVAWKGFAFRIVVEVLFGLWVVLAWLHPPSRPRFSWILVALSGFVVALGLADVLGAAPLRSLWGNFERMQGWIGLVHLYAFFLVAGAVMNPRTWQWFFHVSLGVCAYISADAVLDGLRVLSTAGPRDVRAGGVYGGMGGPVFLGVYLLFHVFLAAFWGLRARAPAARWCHAGAVLLFLVALLLTGTRAAWAGVAAGAALAALLVALRGPDPRVRRITLLGSAAATLAVAALAALAWLARDAVAGVPVLQRIGSTGERAGLMWAVWSQAFQGFLDRPLLGWGQENFTYVFDRYYSGEVFRHAHAWIWNDQPHNVLLKWLVESGAIGLLAYLSIGVATMHALWRRTADRLSLRERSLLTGMLAGYLLYTCAQPDDVVSYVLACAVLAWIHGLSIPSVAAGSPHRPPTWTLIAVVPLVAGAVGYGLERLNLAQIRAGQRLARISHDPVRIADVVAAEGIVATEARETFLNVALYWCERPETPQAFREELVARALAEIEVQLAREPERVRTLFLTGWFLIRVGRPQQALDYLGRARALAPFQPRIVHQIARAHLDLGELDAALAQQQRARELFASRWLDLFYGRAVVILAHAYARQGQPDRGIAILEDALARGFFLFPAFAERELEKLRRR